MKTQEITDFIIIDDNEINNNICQMVIEKTIAEAAVHTFTEPEPGLEYMRNIYSSPRANSAILLLDINMPSLTGWEVLEQFENFPDAVKTAFKIFMLSSSVTQLDKIQADNHERISGYIEKPLTVSRLKEILLQLSLVAEDA